MSEEIAKVEVPTQAIVPHECPFCGAFHARIMRLALARYYVVCRNCESVGPIGLSVDNAASRWNKRPMLDIIRRQHDTECVQPGQGA